MYVIYVYCRVFQRMSTSSHPLLEEEEGAEPGEMRRPCPCLEDPHLQVVVVVAEVRDSPLHSSQHSSSSSSSQRLLHRGGSNLDLDKPQDHLSNSNREMVSE